MRMRIRWKDCDFLIFLASEVLKCIFPGPLLVDLISVLQCEIVDYSCSMSGNHRDTTVKSVDEIK